MAIPLTRRAQFSTKRLDARVLRRRNAGVFLLESGAKTLGPLPAAPRTAGRSATRTRCGSPAPDDRCQHRHVTDGQTDIDPTNLARRGPHQPAADRRLAGGADVPWHIKPRSRAHDRAGQRFGSTASSTTVFVPAAHPHRRDRRVAGRRTYKSATGDGASPIRRITLDAVQSPMTVTGNFRRRVRQPAARTRRLSRHGRAQDGRLPFC